MNATVHSQSSVRVYKGKIEDYYYLHDLLDCTKEIESTNLHRIFHNIWAVKTIIIPIVGNTIVNSDGFQVNVKDCSERHFLEDFSQKFIPTFSDYVQLCSDSPEDKELIETFYQENAAFFETYPQVKTLMLEPLFNTGKLKSLLLTHNSWFIGKILPKIFKDIKIEIKDYSISPAVFFNRCRYDDWLSNGQGKTVPPSFEKIEKNKKTTTQRLFKSAELPADDPIRNIVVDGVKSVVYDGSQVEKQREEFQKVLAESLGSQPFDDNSTMIMDGNLGGFGAIENFKR